MESIEDVSNKWRQFQAEYFTETQVIILRGVNPPIVRPPAL